jgi:hypothetical protein
VKLTHGRGARRESHARRIPQQVRVMIDEARHGHLAGGFGGSSPRASRVRHAGYSAA